PAVDADAATRVAPLRAGGPAACNGGTVSLEGDAPNRFLPGSGVDHDLPAVAEARVGQPVGEVPGQSEVVGPHDPPDAAAGVAAAAEGDAPVGLQDDGVGLVVGLGVEIGGNHAADAEAGVELAVRRVAGDHEVAVRPQGDGVVIGDAGGNDLPVGLD